jgi:hypothetical protein
MGNPMEDIEVLLTRLIDRVNKVLAVANDKADAAKKAADNARFLVFVFGVCLCVFGVLLIVK